MEKATTHILCIWESRDVVRQRQNCAPWRIVAGRFTRLLNVASLGTCDWPASSPSVRVGMAVGKGNKVGVSMTSDWCVPFAPAAPTLCMTTASANQRAAPAHPWSFFVQPDRSRAHEARDLARTRRRRRGPRKKKKIEGTEGRGQEPAIHS